MNEKKATSIWNGYRLIFKRGGSEKWDVLIFSVFVNLLMLTGPIYMIQVYDRVVPSRSIQTLIALTALVAALYFVMSIVDFARTRMISIMGRRVVAFYEPYVFEAQTTPRIYAQPGSGQAAFRSLDQLSAVYQTPALLGYFDVMWIPIYLGVMYILHPMIGLAGLIAAILLIAIALVQQAVSRKRQAMSIKINEGATELASEVVQGRELLAAQSMTSALERRWEGMRNEAALETNRGARVTGFLTALSKSLRLFIQSFMLALGAYLAIQGQILGGAIIAGSILLGRALAPIDQILGQWAPVQAAGIAMDRLEAMVASLPEETKHVDYPHLTAELEMRNVAVIDKDRRPIINQISFEVPAGNALGVIGLSGAGKSTLARAILGLVPLASGEVRLGGVNREHIGAEAFGKKVGYLPQEVHLFSGTLAQNIARMEEEYDSAKVIAAAEAAHVHELILSLPDGYDSVIEPNKTTLSGGQKQRIALARALYDDPLLLILDEPNSALDDAGSQALNLAIRKLKARGGTAVIMTHRPSAIQEVDLLLMLEGGRIRSFGPRDEVLKAVIKRPEPPRPTAIKQVQ